VSNPEEPWLRVAILSAIGGFLAFWFPWYLAGSPKNMIDGMQPISLLLLIVVGLAAGIIAPRHFWLSGLATMSLLPVAAIIEAIYDPTSHNLLGIELVMYGVFTIPAIIGSSVGRIIARRRAG
jgi:hypothetical protein